MKKVAFGGGCHWCSEAIFDSLKGVENVEQGWISSTQLDARAPSEAVIVHFDSLVITLDVLIEIHLFTHSATSKHSLREKYRSAIYTFSDEQQEIAQNILKEKQKLFKKTLITKIYPFSLFTLNEQKYLNYYKSNPQKPFCKLRIEPKLQKLFQKYSEHTKLINKE